MSYSPAIIQNTFHDTGNSSSSDINAGDTWTGVAKSTIGYSLIIVSMTMSQDGQIYIDQGSDGTNWATTTFNYYTMKDGIAVGAKIGSSYFRLRVKNTSSATATSIRINSYLIPVGEPLPGNLDENGYLQTAIKSFKDEYGFVTENTPQNEMRVVIPTRLVGATFTNSTIDTNFWTTTVANSATITQSHSQVLLSTNTNPAGSAIIQSVRSGRYIGGASNRFRGIVQFGDTGVANNIKRWGAFNGVNGVYYKLSGTTLYICTMRDSVEVNAIPSTSWSENRTVPTLTNANIYEIYYTNRTLYFSINGLLVNTISSLTDTWTDTLSLPARADNINSGSTTNSIMYLRAATIYRLGAEKSTPISKYYATAGTEILKYSAGFLHRIIINDGLPGSSITIYDNTAGSGTIIGYINTATVSTPVSIEFGCPFYTGLTIVLVNDVSHTVVYE